MSARAIVLGKGLNFSAHCHVEFGCYVQTHKETDNSMCSCTVGAICLGPSGNDQGGHEFLSRMIQPDDPDNDPDAESDIELENPDGEFFDDITSAHNETNEIDESNEITADLTPSTAEIAGLTDEQNNNPHIGATNIRVEEN